MNKYIIGGVVISFVTILLGILIAFLIPITYTHQEVIYYPNEDKTYLEINDVKQSYLDYLVNDGVYQDKNVLSSQKIELGGFYD